MDKLLLPFGTSVAVDKTWIIMMLSCYSTSLVVRHMYLVLKNSLPTYMIDYQAWARWVLKKAVMV